jgi:predicted negative regulator of RcsB-dependent stress response
MEAQQTHSGDVYDLLGWLDKNRDWLIKLGAALIVVGVIVSYLVWRKGAREIEAGEQLTALLASSAGAPVSAESLLKVAGDFAGTAAGARAQLAAAGQYFSEGKYADAQTQFQQFISVYAENPLAPQASLGVAASLEAQQKNAEASAAYKAIADRKQDMAAATAARFGLARLLITEGKLAAARDLYLELANDQYSMAGSEAASKLAELIQQHPELRPVAPAATNSTSVKAAN